MSNAPSNVTSRKIPAALVCRRYGVVRRTLSRWMIDEELGFPEPCMTVNGRHYFDEAELDNFDKECAKRQAAARVARPHREQAEAA